MHWATCPASGSRRSLTRTTWAAWPAAATTTSRAPTNLTRHLLQYRASILWDAFAYLSAWGVYGHEVNDVKRRFDERKTQEMIVYFVSSAGVSTVEGARGTAPMSGRGGAGFVDQLLWETHGLLSVTMFADHGHSYTPGTRIDLEGFLQKHSWRLTEKLQCPRNVAYIRFGLETYASFCTRQPKLLAEDLICRQGVDLASYAQGRCVIVLAKGGQQAAIRHGRNGFSYEPKRGDPLQPPRFRARVPRAR